MTARSVGSAIDEGSQPSRNVRFSVVIRGKTGHGPESPFRSQMTPLADIQQPNFAVTLKALPGPRVSRKPMVENVAFASRSCRRIAKLGPLADLRIYPIGGDDELDGHGLGSSA